MTAKPSPSLPPGQEGTFRHTGAWRPGHRGTGAQGEATTGPAAGQELTSTGECILREWHPTGPKDQGRAALTTDPIARVSQDAHWVEPNPKKAQDLENNLRMALMAMWVRIGHRDPCSPSPHPDASRPWCGLHSRSLVWLENGERSVPSRSCAHVLRFLVSECAQGAHGSPC